MTDRPSRKAANRKLPGVEVVKSLLEKGFSHREIADQYGVTRAAVGSLVSYHCQINSKRQAPAPNTRPTVCETETKIVVTRMIDTQRGLKPVRISLPRIPTLHGHFRGIAAAH